MHTVLRQHWFWPGVLLLLALEWWAICSGPVDRWLELAVLVDLMLLLPLAYYACYHPKGSRGGLRLAAWSMLGFWLAFLLIPAAERDLLRALTPAGVVGELLFIVLEIGVFVAELTLLLGLYRLLFRQPDEHEARQTLQQYDLPPGLAKLLWLEVRLWKGLLRRVRQLATWLRPR